MGAAIDALVLGIKLWTYDMVVFWPFAASQLLAFTL